MGAGLSTGWPGASTAGPLNFSQNCANLLCRNNISRPATPAENYSTKFVGHNFKILKKLLSKQLRMGVQLQIQFLAAKFSKNTRTITKKIDNLLLLSFAEGKFLI